jgi:hypothetical protein
VASPAQAPSMDLTLSEALNLLALWYARFTGAVVGTPDEMHLRTRALLERTGRTPAPEPRQTVR